ncbi:MAG TPA: sugar phosphate nucleotidyltransferase, partial [Thermogutta sp.]|nr:sugar phosphate nucleotidyltransferase [Thermogutta sp.]
TAPCIGLAALRFLHNDPEAVMVVMPADHVIEPQEAFASDIDLAVQVIEEDPTRLVTFGIVPHYPSPSFGYIERGEALSVAPASPTMPGSSGSMEDRPRVFRAKSFREKPSIQVAEGYLRAGNFYWNAGIFVWKAKTIWDLLKRHQPSVAEPLARILSSSQSPNFPQILESEFSKAEKISIDYAVMEKADNVVVVEAQFRWDDVGSWRSLERLLPADNCGNVSDAERCLLLDTTGCIVRCRDPRHLVATLGVDNLVIVITPDATLVARKDREEDIRKILDKIAESGWREYL